MSNTELIDLLTERGYSVKSASSTVDNISAESLVEEFGARDERESVETPEVAVEAEEKKIEAPAKPALPRGVFVKTKADVDKEREERTQAETQRPAPGRPLKPKVIPAAPVKATPSQSPPGIRPGIRPQSRSGPPAYRRAQTQQAAPAPAPMVRQPPVNPQPAAPPKVEPLPPPEIPVAEEVAEEIAVIDPADLKKLQTKPPIVVRDFAVQIGLKPFQLISELMEMGIFASMNQVIEGEVAQKLARKQGFLLEIRHRGEGQPDDGGKKVEVAEVDESTLLEPRPPVVCILGHVDHGKTTLLDTIRKANVVGGEAGGITQHIGAYQVEHNGHKITFIDTPGHAAFSSMRARGANTTDIAILVAAADDGFMPQTDEALGHARAAKVPIVVAINKIDSKGANIDRVKTQMQERDLAPEDWGGETQTVAISALNGTNISELLDSLILQTEVMESVKANPKCPAEGVIIETQKEVGRGATATVLVQKGTLKSGNALVCGPHFCKVRAMLDDRGGALKSAPPSTPVRVVGWSGPPDSGSTFKVVKNEKAAKLAAEENAIQLKARDWQDVPAEAEASVASLFAAIAETRKKVFRVVVKADVFGTAEALADSLKQIQSDKIDLEVVQAEVGPINSNDVLMASASESAVVGFNVNSEAGVTREAKHHGIEIFQHNVIYELIDLVKDAMAATLDPELRENKTGAAQVRQVFPMGKSQRVAGCLVTEGRIVRDGKARLVRDGEVITESRVGTLKRFKDDATEVRAGYECGIRLGDYDLYEEGDVIECYEILKMRASL